MLGLPFKWESIFSNIYSDIRYDLIFTDKQLEEHIKSWIKLIDAREPYRINDINRINIAKEISIMYSPSDKIEEKLLWFNSWDSIIVICSDWVNCFDAKLIWIELEKKGVNFLGRFTNPDYFIKK